MVASNKVLTAFCLLMISSYNVNSQILDAATDKKNPRRFITNSVQVFKSKTPQSLDSILSKDAYQFQKINNRDVVFSGYDEDYYWFRFVVNNRSDSAKDLVLLLGPLGMKDSELFQGRAGNYRSLGKTGIRYPFNKRPYQYAHFAFPINLRANITDTFYLSMDFDHEYRSYAFVLMESKVLKEFENGFYLNFGIIVGLLLLFLILNLYLYFSLEEKIHLWYALYISFLILIVMVNDELSEQFLGFDSESAYKLAPLSAIGGIAIAILVHVVQLFLTNIRPETLLSKITFWIKCNLVTSALCFYIAFNFQSGIPLQEKIFYWVNYSTILGIVIIFFNCAYSYYWGFKAALPIFLGLSLFFIGCMEKLLTISTPSYLFPPSLFHLGIVLETTTISFVLFYRHRHERRENLQYLREREKLKVAYEKDMLEKKLDWQEKTFKNISQEIHDNIGQLLSLAKLNLNNITPQGSNINHKVTETELLLNKAIHDLNDLSTNTQQHSIVQTGLIDAIEIEVAMIKKTSAHEVQLTTTGQRVPIHQDKEAVLYRIVQEVLNNIVKHADATKISIDLIFKETDFSIKILDNGKGFSMDEIKKNIRKYGLGLRNIESRARSIDAQLDITSNPDHGTEITLTIDLSQSAGQS